MSRKRGPNEPQDIHGEILRHLDQHPPRRPRPNSEAKGAPKSSPTPPPAEAAPPRRPRIMLRKLPLDMALQHLEQRLIELQARGEPEALVVVGKGHGSPEGRPVIAPAAREFCARRADLVIRVEDAPMRDGGDGALLIHLRPRVGT